VLHTHYFNIYYCCLIYFPFLFSLFCRRCLVSRTSHETNGTADAVDRPLRRRATSAALLRIGCSAAGTDGHHEPLSSDEPAVRRRAAVPVSSGGDDQAVARYQRPARLWTNRRHVRTAQELPGLILAGPLVFCLHLPQHTRLRVSVTSQVNVDCQLYGLRLSVLVSRSTANCMIKICCTYVGRTNMCTSLDYSPHMSLCRCGVVFWDLTTQLLLHFLYIALSLLITNWWHFFFFFRFHL